MSAGLGARSSMRASSREQEAVERASVPPAVHVALAELERAPGHQPRRQVRGVDLHVPVAVAVDADIGVGQQGLQSVAEWMRRGHASRRSEEHTSELQSLMRISYAVFFLKKKTQKQKSHNT